MCYAETNESSPSTTEEKQTVSEVQLDVSETKSEKLLGLWQNPSGGSNNNGTLGLLGLPNLSDFVFFLTHPVPRGYQLKI